MINLKRWEIVTNWYESCFISFGILNERLVLFVLESELVAFGLQLLSDFIDVVCVFVIDLFQAHQSVLVLFLRHLNVRLLSLYDQTLVPILQVRLVFENSVGHLVHQLVVPSDLLDVLLQNRTLQTQFFRQHLLLFDHQEDSFNLLNAALVDLLLIL